MRDKHFSGADVWATAYALALGIRKIGLPDLVFCGKQSIDGDTGQLGAELAELLGYAHVYYVSEILDIRHGEITVVSDMGDYVDTIRVKLPAVLSTDSESFTPRVSSFRDKMMSQNKIIEILQVQDLEDKDENNFGYQGSPTRVKRMLVPHIQRAGDILSGNRDDNSEFLLEKIDQWKNMI